MELVWSDRQTVRRSVIADLRRRELCFGDVVTLDAALDPCLDALRDGARTVDAIELTSPAAAAAFVEAFEAAVRTVAGDAFSPQLRTLADAFARVPTRSANAIGEPVDEIDVLVERWVDRIAANDVATAVHSRAVGAWCHRIGMRMGLAPDVVAHVTRCGTIHDVGKVQTPVGILLAPRALTTDEWSVMQRHVTDGFELIVSEPALLPLAPAVRGHHERFDGRGYPDALKGEDITLATRIVSVADAFNAMIASRPYRPPISPMDAVAELEQKRGSQFDPDCVDAMVDVALGRV